VTDPALVKKPLKDRAEDFDRRTEQYLSLGHDRFEAARFVAGCAGELGSPALDVGTGKGLLAMALASNGLEVVSIDISEEDSELAGFLAAERSLAGRIEFAIRDASSLPYESGKFKAVAMMEVLHHLDNAEGVLSEMTRVLSPNGKLIIADFNEEGFGMVAKVHRSEGKEHPRSKCTIDSAASFLCSLGLKEEGRAEAHNNAAVWFSKTP